MENNFYNIGAMYGGVKIYYSEKTGDILFR